MSDTTPTTGVLAWHWLRDDRRLNYPPHTLVEAGQTLRMDGEPVLCARGYHASRRAIDALQYASGPVICRVRVGGVVVEGEDKLAGTERTVLWMADATTVLHEFACWCAEQTLERQRAVGYEPDPRSWAVIEAKRAWLRGEIGDEELRDARAAAWDTAGDATRAAAWDTAGDAASAAARAAASAAASAATRAAAWDAASAAARAAASAAASAATRAAAWDTAGDAARAAASAAAWDTARAAAWDTAWAEQNAELERRLLALADVAVAS